MPVIRPVQLVIAGAQKAGTTSLFQHLQQHPEIHAHEQREMCYFVTDEFKRGYDGVFKKYYGEVDEKGIILAKHVMIMYSQEAIDRLYDHNPDAQIVLLLRNPVRRAYSAYWYARRMGWEKLRQFEDALKAEPGRLREGWLKWSNCAYLYNGEYHLHVKRILGRFNKRQLHIYLLEDLKEDPQRICLEIFALFDIDSGFVPDAGERHNEATQARSETLARAYAAFLRPNNPVKRAIRALFPYTFLYRVRQNLKEANKKSFTPPPMNPETKEYLVRYFKSHNDQLGELIGRNVEHWNVPE